ncbi:MAG: HlyD family efflux transporter periplasmic adaptor subunit [Saprospiraceae bacterium]|nr:HlyD family efflux transporter periplasmic adaptor subunit [Candidatus Defluviibacterium haderslevense]
MKHILFSIIIMLLLASCKNKSEQEQQVMLNIKQTTTTNYVVGVGKIIPENDIIQLSSPVNGIVQKIYKKENDTVRIGSIILELEHQLEDGKIRLLNNERNTQASEIKVDQAGVGEFETKLSNAKSELLRLENLLSKGAETQQTVDDATTNLKTLNANLKKLEATVNVSKSKWQETKTALNTAQLERDQKIIKSPINGRILELTVLIGGSVSIQESIAQISPEGKTIAICEIDESNADKIFVGQKAWIRSVGSSDTLSTGTIYLTYAFLKKKSLLTDQSGEKEDRRVRTIKMFLNQPDHLLLNARVECVIDISSNNNK